jgi:hypothetical protein
VIGLHAAIRQHELEVPEADGELQIPAHSSQVRRDDDEHSGR